MNRIESLDYEAALEATHAAPRAKQGEVWALLCCGDSTDASTVASLLTCDAHSSMTSVTSGLSAKDEQRDAPRTGNDALVLALPELWQQR